MRPRRTGSYPEAKEHHSSSKMIFPFLMFVVSTLLAVLLAGKLYDATQSSVYRRRLATSNRDLQKQLQVVAEDLGFEYFAEVSPGLIKIGDSVLSRWIPPTQLAYRNHVHATLGEEKFDLFEAFLRDAPTSGPEYVLIVCTTSTPTPLALSQMDENSVYVVGNYTVKVRTGRLDPNQLEDFIGSVCHVIDLASTP